MDEALFTLSMPSNEEVRSYAPGSPEKKSLKAELTRLKNEKIEIPLIIGGREIQGNDMAESVIPHNHGHVLATYQLAGPDEIQLAIEASMRARDEWARIPWPERASVFLKAAELLAGPWRDRINAATMLGQSKTVFQAEIDAAAELIDFFRFNAHFMNRIYSEQPASTLGIWDRLDWRPLEGFVFAISPFNFTSIAGNLSCAPAMMGNTALWKPASSSVYSNYWVMRLLLEAGLPDGVINFLPSSGRVIGKEVLAHPDLGGVHFTGSNPTFNRIWKTISDNLPNYRSYPRIVGETGGKNFVVAHPSADVEALITGLVRGAFEFQGQKCSAASRAYIPRSLWADVKDGLVEMLARVKMGDPLDFTNFMGAVIDEKAFDNISGYIDFAEKSNEARIIAGGGYDKSKGYFIEPTVLVTTNPRFKLMEEEIFGPVLTIFVYEDEEWSETLELIDATSPYALTGAVFSQDRGAIHEVSRALRHAAGNFYVNDKPTGAVVGMQPFGGSRASGTNDKAGSMLNLQRWVTPRTIKENFIPPTDFVYPHMDES